MPRCNSGTRLATPSSHTWDEGDGAAGSVLLVQLALPDGHLLAHQLLVAAVGVTCGGEVGGGMVSSVGTAKGGGAQAATVAIGWGWATPDPKPANCGQPTQPSQPHLGSAT